jgi:hypothetical protein
MPANSITFPVDPVRPAERPLPEADYRQAVALHIAGGHDWPRLDAEAEELRQEVREAKRHRDAKRLEDARLQLEHYERALAATRPPEAYSRRNSKLVEGRLNHPFLAAVMRAYADHRPLTISPDMVWLLIAQGAAAHIRAHAEELRAHFVVHAGRKVLTVERDDFIPGSADNPWPEVFSAFSAQVAAHIGPKNHAFFVPTFSTTGPAEKAAFEVTLLDAMRFYFEYMVFICGIPEITLEGTAADWREIASRVGWLDQIGLGKWRDKLRPILAQFVRAAEGDIDTAFWRSIYLYTRHGCIRKGIVPEVTGWIALFFPYLGGRGNRPSKPASWLLDDKAAVGFSADEPGPGFSVAPFTLVAPPNSITEMEFLAGFVGVAQDTRTLALRPEIGWAVRKAPPSAK